MSNDTAVTKTTNIVPVQGIFKPEPTFDLITFIGPAGTPFLPPTSPFLDGVTITNSTINSTTIGALVPAAGNFTNITTVTGQISTLPVNNTDIANKQYVDSVAQGLNVKAACLYSTTANITLSGLATQAGGDWPSSLSAGDRILVKNQTNQAENGIYVASSNGWTRSTDMDVWAEVPSAFTFIQKGTTLADTGWVCTSDPGGTINVTPITWTQFSGAGSYFAGNGLQLTGNTFSVLPNGSTINVSSAGIKISDTYAGQTSITTVGTITAGTWNAGTIQPAYGGTGLSTYTTGDLIYASGATTLSKLSDVATGNVLISGGVGVAPSWGKVDLTAAITGILPIANGGTNNNAVPTAGAVAFGTGTAYAFTGVGTAGQYLQSAGSGTPVWTTISSTNTTGAPAFYATFVANFNQAGGGANVANKVTYDASPVQSNGISASSGNITFANAGFYLIVFELAVQNSAGSNPSVRCWLAQNGTNIPSTTSDIQFTGGAGNTQLLEQQWIVNAAAGDTVAIYWSSAAATVSLAYQAAASTPTRPSSPSAIVNVFSLPQIGIGYAGLTSTSTVTPGTGTKTFTTNLNANATAFTVGTAIRVAYVSDPTQFMQGVITSFSGTTLTVSCDAFSGSTPQSNWSISVAGSSGVTTFSGGSTGLTPSSATYGAVTLGGTLGVGYGGTGKSTYTTGDILYASSSSALSSLGIGSSATILTSSGSIPQWSAPSSVAVGTATNLAGGGAGYVPYQSSAGATSFVSAGSAGQVLTSNGTSAPTWTTPTAYATVTDDTTTNGTRYPLFANQTTGNLTTEYTASTKYQFNPSTGILTATGFSGSGANLTSLPAGQLTGTIPSAVLGNSTLYIGTTAIALNRASASQTLTGTSIDGSAGSATTATTATNANNIAITDNTTSVATWYPIISANSTGNNPATTSSTKLSYVPSTGALSATSFSGAGTGLTGTASSLSIGGNAATATSATTATNVAGGTTGALHYQSAASTTTFLSLGTANYVLTAGASAPQYVAQSTLSVGSATNATNTAITANSTNADYYITVVSANTGNLPQLVASGLTANPSTGKVTGGIAGGAF